MRRRTVIVGAVLLLGGGIVVFTFVRAPRDTSAVAVVPRSERFDPEVGGSRNDAESVTTNQQPEIREMSQTFRHTTFLAAIRRAGFSCDDVVEARESVENVWVASCRDLGGFKISVGGIDSFHVEPIAHYVDRVFQPLMDNEQLPRR